MQELQVTMTELRQNLGELVNQAAYGSKRIVLVSHGQAKAALVGLEDLNRLKELLQPEAPIQPEAASAKPRSRSILPVVRTVKLAEQGNDSAHWRAQSPETRLAALEAIRKEHHRWQHGTEPRLQRVYRIAKR